MDRVVPLPGLLPTPVPRNDRGKGYERPRASRAALAIAWSLLIVNPPAELWPADDRLSDREPRVLSVSELTAELKELVEESFAQVWVVGEISGLSRPASGHVYLVLKDDQAQIRAVLWRSTAARLRFELEDGLEVVCRGRLEVYAPRGTYQLIIEHVEPRGLGALERAFRRLYERLAREGLFDQARKRRLPALVRRIAVVTSPSGAAIHDFLQVLARRWGGAQVLIVPSRVQGEGAAAELAAALAAVNRLRPPPDCVVLTRGGGSLEDLWAFNEEVLVRAIVASRVPVVSAVGHEIDVTLSDLAADVRALTPSHAAELLAPEAEELLARLRETQKRLALAARALASAARSRLDALASHRAFRRPYERIHDLAIRLDEWALRLRQGVSHHLVAARRQADALGARLEALSPLAVLKRGYSITRRAADGRIVCDAAELAPGEQISTRFARGEALCRVEQTSKAESA